MSLSDIEGYAINYNRNEVMHLNVLIKDSLSFVYVH